MTFPQHQYQGVCGCWPRLGLSAWPGEGQHGGQGGPCPMALDPRGRRGLGVQRKVETSSGPGNPGLGTIVTAEGAAGGGQPGDKCAMATPHLRSSSLPVPPSPPSCPAHPESHVFSFALCKCLPPSPSSPSQPHQLNLIPWVLLSPRATQDLGREHPPVCSFPQKAHVYYPLWYCSGTQRSRGLCLPVLACQRQRRTMESTRR